MAQYGNWLGILKWSLAQNDGTHPSEFRPMAEEVRGRLGSGGTRCGGP
jgi:hypothetical protein